MKSAADGGEDVFWAVQNGVTNPTAALEAHLTLNNAPANSSLFAHWHRGRTGPQKLRPLTRTAFKSRIDAVCVSLAIVSPNGHGLRIGGTLELLLQGMDFEVVKSKGRWSGDSFQLYLRRHGVIMAAYIQAQPELQARIVRYSMPRIR